MFTEEWFLKAISGYTARDVEDMIDWGVNLDDLIRRKYGKYLPLARAAARRMRARDPTMPITAEEAMRWLRARRPDLYGAIKSRPGGQEWLEEQVARLKALLGVS